MISSQSNKEAMSMESNHPKMVDFSPYESNEGTIVAVAGDGFVVVASETRLSIGYSIYTRNQSKLFPLTKRSVLGNAGCWCDVLCFTRMMEARIKLYQNEHGKEVSTPAISHLITAMLYHQRFFPYYVYTLLAGMDEDGNSYIYSYDSIGSKGTHRHRAVGKAEHLLQPLLDNQVGRKNFNNETGEFKISLEDAIALVKDTFISAAERDIYTGDGIVMKVMTKDGVTDHYFSLRKD